VFKSGKIVNSSLYAVEQGIEATPQIITQQQGILDGSGTAFAFGQQTIDPHVEVGQAFYVDSAFKVTSVKVFLKKISSEGVYPSDGITAFIYPTYGYPPPLYWFPYTDSLIDSSVNCCTVDDIPEEGGVFIFIFNKPRISKGSYVFVLKRTGGLDDDVYWEVVLNTEMGGNDIYGNGIALGKTTTGVWQLIDLD
jgi:hypothetical protein